MVDMRGNPQVKVQVAKGKARLNFGTEESVWEIVWSNDLEIDRSRRLMLVQEFDPGTKNFRAHTEKILREP